MRHPRKTGALRHFRGTLWPGENRGRPCREDSVFPPPVAAVKTLLRTCNSFRTPFFSVPSQCLTQISPVLSCSQSSKGPICVLNSLSSRHAAVF